MFWSSYRCWNSAATFNNARTNRAVSCDGFKKTLNVINFSTISIFMLYLLKVKREIFKRSIIKLYCLRFKNKTEKCSKTFLKGRTFPIIAVSNFYAHQKPWEKIKSLFNKWQVSHHKHLARYYILKSIDFYGVAANDLEIQHPKVNLSANISRKRTLMILYL